MQEVPESDEDAVEEIAPPSKKSRPSFEPEEEDEVVEVKPRGKRVSSRKPSSTAPNGSPPEAISNGSAGSSAAPKRPARGSTRSTRTSTRRVKKEASDDDDEVQEIEVEGRQPPGRKQRTSVPETIVISDDDDDEVQDVKPTRGRRATASRQPAKKTAAPREAIVVSDDEEEEVKPTRSRKGSARPQPPRSKATARKAVVVSDDDEDEQAEQPREDEEVEREEPIPAPRTVGEDTAEVVESSDAEETDAFPNRVSDHVSEKPEDEEKSLLDPPRTPKAQPQTISSLPEEPQGPKARLVIHKMALVNFKSYAGRQEIGPFHKVCFAEIILCGSCLYDAT